MRRTVLARSAAVGGAILIGAAGFAAVPAAAATAGHVDIRVELDLVEGDGTPWGAGPAVFEVVDAPIVAGPELTGADIVENPSGWCGSVTVDVDPTARTITVAAEEQCDFTVVRLWVSSPDFGAVQLVSDDLLVPDEEEGPIEPEPETIVPLEVAPDQLRNGPEPSSDEVLDPAPLAIGASSGAISSRVVIAPMAAPGSSAVLTTAFAAPLLSASWQVSQAGAGPDEVLTEDLAGSTVWTYTTPAATLSATGGGDATPLLLGAGALMLVGAAAIGVVGLRRRDETA